MPTWLLNALWSSMDCFSRLRMRDGRDRAARLGASMRDASICFWDLITSGCYYRAVAVCAPDVAMWLCFSELCSVTGRGKGVDLLGIETG
jgi:hypothetical protein